MNGPQDGPEPRQTLLWTQKLPRCRWSLRPSARCHTRIIGLHNQKLHHSSAHWTNSPKRTRPTQPQFVNKLAEPLMMWRADRRAESVRSL
ncbi:hypothetical protein OJAV_G00216920 [Oryzias javanicus]|uniref:Uncharacterized protein n=1 Tax=Oryzias javanicus TaxID=123683 RepID=A0A437C4J6_ORYJA|nr:hypothetical protein OJAV_G00216920 [Oryzias javanicus]